MSLADASGARERLLKHLADKAGAPIELTAEDAAPWALQLLVAARKMAAREGRELPLGEVAARAISRIGVQETDGD